MKELWHCGLGIFAIITKSEGYNIQEMPVSIINKPDVVFGADKVTKLSLLAINPLRLTKYNIQGSLFGYSLAAHNDYKELTGFDEKENILIGAPMFSETGALFNCDVYGKCKPFYSGK